MIDVKNKKLFLQVGEEKLEFNLEQAITPSVLKGTCYLVDILEKIAMQKAALPRPPLDPLEAGFIGSHR